MCTQKKQKCTQKIQKCVHVGGVRMKQCSKCLETKPYEEFYVREFTPDGYQYHCKQCIKTKRNEHYKRNKKTTNIPKRPRQINIKKKIEQIEKLLSELKATL
jgi:hypothetical protein